FLNELMVQHNIPTPKTIVVHRGNKNDVIQEIGFPCVLKQPDSYFSQGVHKAEDEAQFNILVNDLLNRSDLIIVQEYSPTDFDWRIGVLNNRPLFACKYYMAK